MDKRTKILLIVLVALIVLSGAYVGYMKMTAEEIVATTEAPAPVAKKAPAPPAQTAPVETPEAEPTEAVVPPGQQEAEPGAKQPEEGKTAEAVKEPAAAAPEMAAAPEKPAAPEKQAAKEKAVLGKKAEKAPPKDANTAEKPAKPAPCVPVIRVKIKGKVVEYKSPEEVMEKSGMDENALKKFGADNIDDVKKKLAGLEKSKAAKEDVECAKKELEMAESLVKLVEAKYPAEPVKEVYTYSSLDKRDPFMAPSEIPLRFPKVEANAPPLERVPSESLDVKGIMWNEKGYRALVATNDGRAYTVKVGDTIGDKRGKVARITEKRLYIEERIPDIFGDIEVRNIVLKLHKEAE